jgi:hypothetical protein
VHASCRRMSSEVRGLLSLLRASHKTNLKRIAATALALIAALTVVVAPAASAAGGSITVTNQNDSGPGSLRQAIADAAPGDTVIVPAGPAGPAGLPTPYVLSSGELVISKTLTIAGAGATTTIIDAQNRAFRVIHTMGAGNQITISGVTIRNGTAVPPPLPPQATGGGLLNDEATVTLNDDVITGNEANAEGKAVASGGGVWSSGPLSLIDTDVKGNTASAAGLPGQGGASASGGGVFSSGTLAVRGSTFEGNLADARGALGEPGGSADGGAIAVTNAPADIAGSTFHDNVVDASVGQGGANVGADGFAAGGGASLSNASGAVSETNVTYAGNTARATGGTTRGGGIFFFSSAGASLTNATITANSAAGGTDNQGGDIFVRNDATVGIANTILSAGAADAGSENCGTDGTLSSLGNNLDSRDQCGLHGRGDLVNRDPLLGELQANGGPVDTAALKPGSPAIDTAGAAACPTADARGVHRPVGGGCDMGAFEVATPGATTGRASSVTTASGVLNATASNPDLTPGTVFFQFGTTTAYGSKTATQPISSATAALAVSAGLTGLSPRTTYHFRLVTSNSAGTATGADGTFTTAPAPTTPPPPQVAIRAVAITGATATVNLACEGAAGQRCSGTLRGTVRERLRGSSVVAIQPAARSASRGTTRTRTVVVARGSFNVSAGRDATVRITANATGKMLLRRFYRLPTTVLVVGPNSLQRVINFAFPRVRVRVDDFFVAKLVPCGPCTTVVQLLTITRIPQRSRVSVSCRGVGCPFATREPKPRRGHLDVAALFGRSQLDTGTKLEIRIIAPNRVGEALLYTIRTGTLPRATIRCLPPGARSPVTCRAGS